MVNPDGKTRAHECPGWRCVQQTMGRARRQQMSCLASQAGGRLAAHAICTFEDGEGCVRLHLVEKRDIDLAGKVKQLVERRRHPCQVSPPSLALQREGERRARALVNAGWRCQFLKLQSSSCSTHLWRFVRARSWRSMAVCDEHARAMQKDRDAGG
jgi:hypothetical protein